MIESFFRNLERERVAYLLISGQATILYGAATFSEDVDLWVEPTSTNVDAFRRTLQAVQARYYKLSPPLDSDLMRRGHGFHFVLPGKPEIYLDVMGCPPRVPPYAETAADAERIETLWGCIPTIGIRHLADLKKTQRLGDYPIIGRLALRYLERIPTPGEDDYEWAIAQMFTLEDLEELLTNYPDAAKVLSPGSPLHSFGVSRVAGQDVPETLRNAVEAELTARMQAARQADRVYWKEIIAELKTMRADGRIMAPGALV